MIIQRKCKECGEVIRANGEIRFSTKVREHYEFMHEKLFQKMLKARKKANSELKLLEEKYPFLWLYFGHFRFYCNGLTTEEEK